MSKRKTYGNLLLLSGLVLGVFLLLGSFIWMQDKANMLLAVFVLILYGMGQWLTVVYWQRIQADWETTGETLARLQQAVTDIPAALDSNLKAIASRLSENQQKALAQLQSDVNEGARATLEKGAALIGDSLGRNFQAPMDSLRSILQGAVDNSQSQSQRLEELTQKALAQNTESAAKGVSLLNETLDKNLRGPIADLRGALEAWQKNTQAHLEALRDTQREGAAEAKTLAASVTEEFKTLAGSTTAEIKTLAQGNARAGEEARAAWASEAKRVLEGWETRVQGFEQRVLAELGREAGRVGDALAQSAGAFEAGLAKIREASQDLIDGVEQRAAAAQAALVKEVSEAQGSVLREAGSNIEAQSRLGLELAEKVSTLAETMGQGAKDYQELASLSRINQAEMQAGVGMLNSGLASILARLDQQASAGDGFQTFLAEMGKALAAFQERAGEALMENALKTQEILMEVLNQAERKTAEAAAA